jgi:hypothetical protein
VAPPSANPLTRASAETTTAGLQFLRPQYQPPQRMPGLFAGRDLGPTQDEINHTQAKELSELTLGRQEKIAGINHQGTLAEIAARGDESRLTAAQKAAAQKELAGITTGPRHDANRTRIAALYLQAGGDPAGLPQFMAGFAEPKAPEVGPALPPMQFGGALDAGKLFPNGTAAQSRMGLQKSQQGVNEARVPLIGAQTGLTNARAADVPVAAQDRRTRVTTGAKAQQETARHHQAIEKARAADRALKASLGNRGLDIRSAAQSARSAVAALKESDEQLTVSQREMLRGNTQRLRGLETEISRIEREMLKGDIDETKGRAWVSGLRNSLGGLIKERENLMSAAGTRVSVRDAWAPAKKSRRQSALSAFQKKYGRAPKPHEQRILFQGVENDEDL